MSSVKNYSWSAAVFIKWEIVIIILIIIVEYDKSCPTPKRFIKVVHTTPYMKMENCDGFEDYDYVYKHTIKLDGDYDLKNCDFCYLQYMYYTHT